MIILQYMYLIDFPSIHFMIDEMARSTRGVTQWAHKYLVQRHYLPECVNYCE